MKSDLGWCGPTNFRHRPGTLLTLKGVQLWWGGWGCGGELFLVQLLTLKGVQQLWWGRWGGGGELLLIKLLLLRPAGASGHWAGCAVPRATTGNKEQVVRMGNYPLRFLQGCGSGSESKSESGLDSGFNRVSGSRCGSGSRRAKMTHKSRNFFSKFMF
jgi:hypothetical protein